jgi:soluble lytic murein transglycosylase-like protein
MPAESSSAALGASDLKPRPRFRKGASLLALFAGVVLFGLVARNPHGTAFEEALSQMLPMEALHFATVEEPAAPTPVAAETPRADPNEGRYRALSGFLARRYRVSEDATFDLVSMAHAAGHQIGLDPLLIIAVIAVESRFNPIAESVAGAKGLMQVIPKYHTEKLQEFGGEQSVFDPRINILVGTQILKEYVRRTGSTTSALQMYAGAVDDAQDGYSTKVLSEKRRLQSVVSQAQRKSVRVAQASTLGLDDRK